MFNFFFPTLISSIPQEKRTQPPESSHYLPLTTIGEWLNKVGYIYSSGGYRAINMIILKAAETWKHAVQPSISPSMEKNVFFVFSISE